MHHRRRDDRPSAAKVLSQAHARRLGRQTKAIVSSETGFRQETASTTGQHLGCEGNRMIFNTSLMRARPLLNETFAPNR